MRIRAKRIVRVARRCRSAASCSQAGIVAVLVVAEGGTEKYRATSNLSGIGRIVHRRRRSRCSAGRRVFEWIQAPRQKAQLVSVLAAAHTHKRCKARRGTVVLPGSSCRIGSNIARLGMIRS
jgi:hypothetical protein